MYNFTFCNREPRQTPDFEKIHNYSDNMLHYKFDNFIVKFFNKGLKYEYD